MSTIARAADGPAGPSRGLEDVPQRAGLVVVLHAGVDAVAENMTRSLVEVLHAYRLATLRIDLLGATESPGPAREGLLADALARCTLPANPVHQEVGLLGERQCAALALRVAARQPGKVAALVALGGRCGIEREPLSGVHAPTLLLVGARDTAALACNRVALGRLRGEKRLEVVPQAGPRFVEPGSLVAAAHLAAWWFASHLPTAARA